MRALPCSLFLVALLIHNVNAQLPTDEQRRFINTLIESSNEMAARLLSQVRDSEACFGYMDTVQVVTGIYWKAICQCQLNPTLYQFRKANDQMISLTVDDAPLVSLHEQMISSFRSLHRVTTSVQALGVNGRMDLAKGRQLESQFRVELENFGSINKRFYILLQDLYKRREAAGDGTLKANAPSQVYDQLVYERMVLDSLKKFGINDVDSLLSFIALNDKRIKTLQSYNTGGMERLGSNRMRRFETVISSLQHLKFAHAHDKYRSSKRRIVSTYLDLVEKFNEAVSIYNEGLVSTLVEHKLYRSLYQIYMVPEP